jgi:hypothetical protein
MMYPSQDALGSRLGCILQCNTEGDPNTCRALSKQNLREAHTSNCRAGSRGLWINTLSAGPPPARSSLPDTRVDIPTRSPTSGSKSRNCAQRSMRQTKSMLPISVLANTPYSSRCIRLLLLTHASSRMRTATPSRFTFWMKPLPQLSQPLRLNRYRVTVRLASATNTSSGTR